MPMNRLSPLRPRAAGSAWPLGLLLPLLFAVAGCVSVTRTLPDGSTERLRGDDIREYAGAVFRRHNAASSALLTALPFIEDDAPDVAERLLAADERMSAACAPIDRVAIAWRDEGAVDLGDKVAFARALNDCQTQTVALEAALAQAGIPVS